MTDKFVDGDTKLFCVSISFTTTYLNMMQEFSKLDTNFHLMDVNVLYRCISLVLNAQSSVSMYDGWKNHQE